ncbi:MULTISPECIES: hypothetical protein [unclassified Streptomyces]|uniref:hypothetical protein n=1 Tax=unclassified Streptomyces TaxID=2593676 RepID=UPI00236646D1|nr:MULTISPECIES: hypothetical protein [unclassified Streptomyces]MDF3146596.1 hypothetical protein [Streptomyces sp. T21Q-yed]WDF43728.1 hypothetical protein PBV52_46615 [Streptomyces sp. T12]
MGHDAHRWSTFHGERTLVVAARTVTSTVRVLETLPALLRDDTRVTVVFAHDPTSAFNAGVLDLLHAAGCRVAPWEQLGRISPDLILSASENVDVPEGDCPVLVLPHGVGFQKFVPDSRSPHDRLSGVVPDSLLESGRAWLAISHPAQEEQLLATHPKAAGRTLLVGDPCFDEIVGSGARRSVYREALGLADHQRLIMVSSTWGPTSLLGAQPDLLPRLLAQLPCDEYRVGAIIHPNVWSAHGAWQIRTLQAAALEAGLLLMPAVHAWRPALVAADVLLGDHGSVTLYGASAGKPLLLAAFGGDAVPGTAVHELAAVAPRLDPRGDLRQQVDDVVHEHTPQRYAEVAAQAFAEPGHALARLRTALYHLLKLPEPSSPPPTPLMLPVPDPPAAPVTSWQVTTGVTTDDTAPTVTVRRFPATVTAYGEALPDSPAHFTHLACADDERDLRLTESASVLVRRNPTPTSVGALRWIEQTLAQLPGSLLAASAVRGGGCLVGLRDGRVVEAAATGPELDPGLPAAVVYACLRAGLPLDDIRVTLHIGDLRDEDVVLRLRPALPTG